MTGESRFIDALKGLAVDPSARGLADDCAVLPDMRGALVATHDMIVEGVHFLKGANPADIAWRLVAVNLSDLAAAGATPVGVLLGYSLAESDDWDTRFVEGLGAALHHFGVPLLGGDTVRMPQGAARAFGLTAIGKAGPNGAPSRAGAKAGDIVWVTGTIGDAGAGLALAQQGQSEPTALLAAHNRPQPKLAEGQALGPLVSAMMDISDGLLVDARRMAEASGVALHIRLDAVPLSEAYKAHSGGGIEARLAAATAGDDYQLLFTLGEGLVPPVDATAIGHVAEGTGLSLSFAGEALPLPDRLGYQH